MLWPLLTELGLAAKVGGASAMQEKLLFLAIALRLDKFLTLDNENNLSLFSLNRNFALPLWAKKLLILRNGPSAGALNHFTT